MAGKKRSISLSVDMCDVQKEWGEALCPICLEHPHNAVLLLCSSHVKGCRSYICDTSHKHSNCLDRFKKLKDSGNTSSSRSLFINQQASTDYSFPELISVLENQASVFEHRGAHNLSQRNLTTTRNSETVGRENNATMRDQTELATKSILKCPLCRGDVFEWTVDVEAREHLNLKSRSCTHDSCDFIGNYHELRKHARSVHSGIRPAEVDPSRVCAWQRFEHRREHDDVISAVRSALPGAIVMGDYVTENSDSLSFERDRMSSSDANGSLTTLHLHQMVEHVQNIVRLRSHRHGLGSSTSYRGGSEYAEDGSDSSFTEDDDNAADVSTQDTSLHVGIRHSRRLTQPRSSRHRQ